MSERYFAWKDGIRSEENQEWVELTRSEYVKLVKLHNGHLCLPRRYFYRVPGLDPSDDYIFMECTYEQYRRSNAEKQKRARQREASGKAEENNRQYVCVSFDEPIEDETGDICDLHDLVADPDSEFETRLVDNMALEKAF